MRIIQVKKSFITNNLGALGHFYVVEHKIFYKQKKENLERTKILKKSFLDINKAQKYYNSANKISLFFKFLLQRR